MIRLDYYTITIYIIYEVVKEETESTSTGSADHSYVICTICMICAFMDCRILLQTVLAFMLSFLISKLYG